MSLRSPLWSDLSTTSSRAFRVDDSSLSLDAIGSSLHIGFSSLAVSGLTMLSAGYLIYSGVMPLVKSFFTIFFGWLLANRGMFPPVASRGASHVAMSVALPALIFSSVVPAFTPSNVSVLGPMFLLSFLYQGLGCLLGILIREVCYVPRNFWQGIVLVTGMSNWGNLPYAVVMSVTAQPPFDPNTDPALASSCVSVFVVTYFLTFFSGGAARSLSWDYLPGVPQGEEAERPVPWREKPIGRLIVRYLFRTRAPPQPPSTPEKNVEFKEEKTLRESEVPSTEVHPDDVRYFNDDSDVQLTRRSSCLSTVSKNAIAADVIPLSRRPSVAHLSASAHTLHETASVAPPTRIFPQWLLQVLGFLNGAVTPITVSLAVSIPIALIQDLKALFVDVSDSGGPSWHGPDGRPPLAFVMDTAQFIGNMSVPLALVILGASFAWLRIPRPLSRLPILAMILVTVAKLVVLPIIGIFLVQSMVTGGLIDKNAKAEKFVAIFLSGVPAAVNQLLVTAVYSPDGTSDTLSAFLLIQYIATFFSSAALTAVTLLLV
ncbi:auxin efflux carrier [Obba rivulosa]|uniref:Auxin efflux carrier n=1 Tax=Obba rivulosa TaxID=1052685 RepID=A0A8E2DRH8_9APHY|nr:auxin efflux carrier [Obba rivulosa]